MADAPWDPEDDEQYEDDRAERNFRFTLGAVGLSALWCVVCANAYAVASRDANAESITRATALMGAIVGVPVLLVSVYAAGTLWFRRRKERARREARARR